MDPALDVPVVQLEQAPDLGFLNPSAGDAGVKIGIALAPLVIPDRGRPGVICLGGPHVDPGGLIRPVNPAPQATALVLTARKDVALCFEQSDGVLLIGTVGRAAGSDEVRHGGVKVAKLPAGANDAAVTGVVLDEAARREESLPVGLGAEAGDEGTGRLRTFLEDAGEHAAGARGHGRHPFSLREVLVDRVAAKE